jgi:hypothetical protein
MDNLLSLIQRELNGVNRPYEPPYSQPITVLKGDKGEKGDRGEPGPPGDSTTPFVGMVRLTGSSLEYYSESGEWLAVTLPSTGGGINQAALDFAIAPLNSLLAQKVSTQKAASFATAAASITSGTPQDF